MNNKAENRYAIIMAGGIGSRFWPESRVAKPKQFIDVLGIGRTLIQSTFDRLQRTIDKDNIYIVTSAEYYEHVHTQLPELKAENLILEPERKNTAPCIGYACYKIANLNSKANIVITPADHIIIGDVKFDTIIENCLNYVDKNNFLVTIGIKPNRPATGYGYIQYLEDDTLLFKKVKTFTEKPNEDLAKAFINSGDFLWNSGIFVWNVNSFKSAFSKALPDMSSLLDGVEIDMNTPKEAQVIQNIYSRFHNISIDYGLMEKATNVSIIPADFSWSDLGTWTSIYENLEKDYLGNAAVNKNLVKIYDSSNNLIVSPKNKLVIVEGIEGKCIIDTPNALMILSMNKEQEVKNITADLKREKLDKFL